MKRILGLLLVAAVFVMCLPCVSLASTGYEFDITNTEELYSGVDYSDAQWIKDEDFFGKWNSDEQKWDKEPYFNYEKYSDVLYDVELAAKEGDYEKAKEEITKYYKTKFLSQPRTINSSNNKATVLTAKLEAYNCFFLGNATPLDILYFTNSEKNIAADITDEVQGVTGDTKKLRTFEICSIESGDEMVKIHSRETNEAPYVEAEVNGQTKKFPVIRDTYLRGGSHKTENHGTEESLYVCENTDYTVAEQPPIYTDTPQNPDFSDTMRTRMTVDFTGLVSGDEISFAKLVMIGSTDQAEGGQKCILFSNLNGDGEETGSNWSWEKANRVYNCFDGQPGPLIYRDNYDVSQQMCYENYSALYSVYRATDDEIYAYHAFRLYNNYIRAYGHKVPAHTKLEMGTKGSDMPVLLAHLAPSRYFNADNFIPILKYIWILAEGLVNEWDSQAESSNWGLYETAGLANLAVNFKEFTNAEAPMVEGGSFGHGNSGGWKEVMSHRYDILSGNLLREDRSFRETLGYGKESLNQYLSYATYAEEAGEPFSFGDKIKSNLSDYGKYMMTATGPDFRDYQIGDSYGYVTSFRSVLKKLGALTEDPYLIWAGSYGKEGEKPNYTSKVYPENRKAMFKTGWGDNDLYMDFTSDQTVATHNHPDDLNIVMFAYGQYLLSDQKQFSYTVDSPQRNWVYSTEAHNTLAIPGVTHKANISGIYSGKRPTIDGGYIIYNRDTEAYPGTIHRTELNDAYDYVEMSHPNYENYIVEGEMLANVNCKRSVLLMKKGRYVLVNDYVTALDDNDYDIRQNWHMLPEADIKMTEDGIAKSNFVGANIQIIPIDKNDGMEKKLLDGYYSPQNESLLECKYATYEKGGSGDKTFSTILLPTKPGANIEAISENLKTDTSGTAVDAYRVTMSDKDLNQVVETSVYKLNDERYKAKRVFGDYSTDASLAVVEKIGGNYSQIVIQDGKNLTDTTSNKIVFYAKESIPEFSTVFDDSIIELYSSRNIDLEKLTIRSEKKVTAVKLNGENIPFNYYNKYVYFGNEPLLADKSEEETETKKDTASELQHGNKGSGGSDGSAHSSGGLSGESVKPAVKPSDAFKSETSGHWAESEINSLIDKGIIKGNPSGSLDLKAEITRAEMLALLLRAMGKKEALYNGEFADVNGNEWYAGTIAAAKALALCDGDGVNALPCAALTREQMAKLVSESAKLIEKVGDGNTIEYADNDKISDWAKEYVNEATRLKIMNGMDNNLFNPQGKVLREQAFAAIARLCI